MPPFAAGPHVAYGSGSTALRTRIVFSVWEALNSLPVDRQDPSRLALCRPLVLRRVWRAVRRVAVLVEWATYCVGDRGVGSGRGGAGVDGQGAGGGGR